MPAFWKHTYHLVWATHKRQPALREDIEQQVHGFLAEKATELGCVVYAINGMADHVHLVLGIPPQQSVSTVIGKLKGASSHYINTFLALDNDLFRWQEGFGSFTMGERQREIAVSYVRNQKRHHAELTTNAWLENTGTANESDRPETTSNP